MNINPSTVLAIARQKSTDFTEMYKKIHDLVDSKPGREVYLRPSMFPVCSLTLLDATLHHTLGTEGDWNYASHYFTGVGTQVHETIEHWCGQTDARMWGNWHCEHCGHDWHHTDDSECPKCKGHGSYREIEIEYLGVKGHIDAILITAKGVIVGDYKTSTLNKIQNAQFKKYNIAYALQIGSYAYMLSKVWGAHFKKKYGLSVIGASLLFISRDNPFRSREFHFDSRILDYGRRVIWKAYLDFRRMQMTLEDKNIERLVNCRLCKNIEHYNQEIKSYHTYGDCHLLELCVGSSNKSVIKQHFAKLFKEIS